FHPLPLFPLFLRCPPPFPLSLLFFLPHPLPHFHLCFTLYLTFLCFFAVLLFVCFFCSFFLSLVFRPAFSRQQTSVKRGSLSTVRVQRRRRRVRCQFQVGPL